MKTHKKNKLTDVLFSSPFIGIPLFLCVVSLVFYVSFSSLGEYLTRLLETLFLAFLKKLRGLLIAWGVTEGMCRFLVDGILCSVASVTAFLPQTAILFFLLDFLRDCGYLARAAAAMTGIFRPLGITGHAALPLLLGFGCSVPGILASEELEQNDRDAIALALSFIPCNARLPVLMFLISSFFEDHTALAATFFYLLMIVAAMLSIRIFSKKKPLSATLSPKLPPLRFPSAKPMLAEILRKSRDFLVRAGTLVFLSDTMIHLLSRLTPALRWTEAPEQSILMLIGRGLAPLFHLLGFGNAPASAALVMGFFAKESIETTLRLLLPQTPMHTFTKEGLLAFTFFSMTYFPCAATLFSMHQALGKKRTARICAQNILFSYAISFVFHAFSHVFFSFCS